LLGVADPKAKASDDGQKRELRRERVLCHGLPREVVRVIRAELRRHCSDIPLDVLDSVVGRLAAIHRQK
jgi:hypothetical protein